MPSSASERAHARLASRATAIAVSACAGGASARVASARRRRRPATRTGTPSSVISGHCTVRVDVAFGGVQASPPAARELSPRSRAHRQRPRSARHRDEGEREHVARQRQVHLAAARRTRPAGRPPASDVRSRSTCGALGGAVLGQHRPGQHEQRAARSRSARGIDPRPRTQACAMRECGLRACAEIQWMVDRFQGVVGRGPVSDRDAVSLAARKTSAPTTCKRARNPRSRPAANASWEATEIGLPKTRRPPASARRSTGPLDTTVRRANPPIRPGVRPQGSRSVHSGSEPGSRRRTSPKEGRAGAGTVCGRTSYIMPPMPPMPPMSGMPPPAGSSFFGASAIIASVVIIRPATEAAF